SGGRRAERGEGGLVVGGRLLQIDCLGARRGVRSERDPVVRRLRLLHGRACLLHLRLRRDDRVLLWRLLEQGQRGLGLLQRRARVGDARLGGGAVGGQRTLFELGQVVVRLRQRRLRRDDVRGSRGLVRLDVGGVRDLAADLD